MPALFEYSNVYNSAILVLQAKGFQVWYDDECDLFRAEKDGWEFVSPSPCGLLGLVAMYEFVRPTEFREYWWRVGGPDVSETLPTKPPKPFVPVYERGAASRRGAMGVATKNIQVIDGAENCTYDIFQISEHDFLLLFPDPGQDIEFSEDFFARNSEAETIFGRLWEVRLDKGSVSGIHGTLFCGLEDRKRYYPTKREAEMITSFGLPYYRKTE